MVVLTLPNRFRVGTRHNWYSCSVFLEDTRERDSLPSQYLFFKFLGKPADLTTWAYNLREILVNAEPDQRVFWSGIPYTVYSSGLVAIETKAYTAFFDYAILLAVCDSIREEWAEVDYLDTIGDSN